MPDSSYILLDHQSIIHLTHSNSSDIVPLDRIPETTLDRLANEPHPPRVFQLLLGRQPILTSPIGRATPRSELARPSSERFLHIERSHRAKDLIGVVELLLAEGGTDIG